MSAQVARLLGLGGSSRHKGSERESYREPERRHQHRYSAEPTSYEDDDYDNSRRSASRHKSRRSERDVERIDIRPERPPRHSSTRSRRYDEQSYPSSSRRDREYSRDRNDDKVERRRETWPPVRPSSQALRRTNIEGQYSYISPSMEDYYDPHDHTSHRDMYTEERPPTPPVLSDGTVVLPIQRRQTDSMVLDRHTARRAKEIWREDPHLRPGSRTIEIPDGNSVQIMTEETWNSGVIDRKLASDIAFSDVNYARERARLSLEQQDQFTRAYFPSIASYKQRCRAATATSLREIDDIVTGMKESVLRVIVYADLAGIRRVSKSMRSRPDKDPLYRNFAIHLDADINDIKSEWRKRPESSKSEAWAVDQFRSTYGKFMTRKQVIEDRSRSTRDKIDYD